MTNMLGFINNQILNLGNLVGLATLIGIFIAFIEYKDRLFDRQKQVLASLKHQLEISGSWASANNEGYIGEPSDDRKIVMTDPFYIIYNIENSALKDVMVQPGIVDFTDKFNNALANYNQHISRIRDLEKFREDLCTENIDLCQIIREKIKLEQRKSKKEQNFQNFLNSFDENKTEEKKAKFLANKFYNYSYIIHYQLIGSRNSGGLKQFYHILDEERVKQGENIVKKIKFFNFIFFILLLFLSFGFVSFLGLKFKNLEQTIILILGLCMGSLIYHYRYLKKDSLCN